MTPSEHLRSLTWKGAAERYPDGVPARVHQAIEDELKLIDELSYAPYFLTVQDLVVFARSKGILCQGRGAAANSAVCYCLGVTSVDPDRINLLFERFVSRERNEPPDIDIDFEHDRREEVIQYIYKKYGRDRAALTAEVISYRGRSAVRDVGKALGLSQDCVDSLAKTLDWWDEGAIQTQRLRELGLNPDDRTLKLVLRLTGQLLGFPRHLSQHVGGFVITNTPLSELVPIENAAMEDRTVIEWDKDDIDAMGMLKVDCLGLGMLTCIRKAFEMVKAHSGRDLTLASVPAEDSAVYDMACRADTVGVFQIESRAQMSMLPRHKPRCFYDLVIEVAIVRPGPIQGNMVHPYLRRRSGEEPYSYPNEAVRQVLGRTLGVPLFQEQAMQLAIVAAGFTPGQADQLRRAMAAWKRKGDLIYRFGEQLIAGMLANGYEREFAERCFEQIKGFSEYGFPESHAASFALLVYVSLWLKCYYPTAFAAALINSQPMGFYAPAQIVRDAKEHGVQALPIDVNHSHWDCTLEAGGVDLRLGTRLISGLSQIHADAIAVERARGGPYGTVEEVKRRAGVPAAALRRLARADAFCSCGVDRQGALWAIQPIRDEQLPIFNGAASIDEPCKVLPFVDEPKRVRDDYAATGLSLKAHPVSFLRPHLDKLEATRAGDLRDESRFRQGASVSVAGIVLVRQRPGTASGIVFITLEDETGVANLIVRPKVFERYRRAARHSRIILCSGTIERQGMVVHVQVCKLQSADTLGEVIQAKSRDFH
jgi:error-prone DNA polymerase